jgi:pSer/pThr/pTyr-binding forkhead associated (FHA) protein
MSEIIFDREKDTKVIYEINKNEITIGRGVDNNVQVLDKLVSRHHCKITNMESSGFAIEDLNTSNGTFIKGHMVIKECELSHEDKIQIGDTFMTLLTEEGETPLLVIRKAEENIEEEAKQEKGYVTIMAEVAGEAKKASIEKIKKDIEDKGGSTSVFMTAFQKLGYSLEDAKRLAKEAKGERQDTFNELDIKNVSTPKAGEIIIKIKRQLPDVSISNLVVYKNKDYYVVGIIARPDMSLVEYHLKQC